MKSMDVQTLKLGRERFVVMKERDFQQLKAKADLHRSPGRPRRLTAQDNGDIAEAHRRRNEAVHSYSELRKELRLK
jgi:hypothetical protein